MNKKYPAMEPGLSILAAHPLAQEGSICLVWLVHATDNIQCLRIGTTETGKVDHRVQQVLVQQIACEIVHLHCLLT
jgi:hypothetical protein